MKGDPATDWRI